MQREGKGRGQSGKDRIDSKRGESSDMGVSKREEKGESEEKVGEDRMGQWQAERVGGRKKGEMRK